MINNFEMEVGGRSLRFEQGKVAKQAAGAVTLQYGDTMILATVAASKEPKDLDFLPLTVEVSEKAYAAGKLPGGFFKREGRPSSEAILAARMVDRPIRPLFAKTIHNEIQIIISVLSSDGENPYPAMGIIGASTALAISDLPFDDPIGACVIGLIDGELIVNPTYEELKTSQLELMVAGTGDSVMMVESAGNFVSESVLLDALQLAQEVNGQIVDQIIEIQKKVGVKKWVAPEVSEDDKSAFEATKKHIGQDFLNTLKDPGDKKERLDRISELMNKTIEALGEEHEPSKIKNALYSLETEAVRKAILEDGQRPDGRKLDEIRNLNTEIGYLPRVHGSSIFTRGETQIMGVLTLASAGEHQRLDNFTPEDEKYFIHHYNFPPYSVGEAGRFGFTGRREIGHGALAEKALKPVVPSQEEFPYTIRLVSEALESNGSTSMASVCAGSLAMMDGGVPIKAPVAGIAMGLITDESGNHAILTDIQGAEDHSGDMDFKVAGTREGVTALQMDIKVKGITFEIMNKALDQAKIARLAILDNMEATIASSRDDISEFAPRMINVNVPKDKIGAVIGSGGSTIRSIVDDFGVTVDVDDDGVVTIGSSDKEAAENAKKFIENLVKEVEVGEIYKGKVVRIMSFGAFVQILPGKDGMVHISELANERVPEVESVVTIGDEVEVKVIKVDNQGRIDLSMKALLPGADNSENHNDKDSEKERPKRRNNNSQRRRVSGGFDRSKKPKRPSR
ncbi:MAG: polyribonucleotide nucleotidyltransferase [Dehalococcoidia bacterium]